MNEVYHEPIESSPRYAARVIKSCHGCGRDISLKPSQVALTNFCNRSCREVERVDNSCARCGLIFQTTKRKRRQYCSQACFNTRRSSAEGLELQAILLARIQKTDSGCWNWTGCIRRSRVAIAGGKVGTRIAGSIRMGGGKNELAHRTSYRAFKGPIPDGLTIDHLCFNSRCINPDHLEAVTSSENTRRFCVAHRARKASEGVSQHG